MKSDPFIADLHIHSKYSRATARSLDLENIYIWAQLKGITVVGTGDFTHPRWFGEISDKLEPAEAGLYRLRSDIAAACDEAVPPSCRAPVRFLLSCEISSIYKKKGATRKNHNLVFFPDRRCVQRFNHRLDAIGNLNADGRPILGLDARDLLEIVLETCQDGLLVPAHIWTPWFSMLGSRSGFDSVQACFEDLSPYIVAAETGLSSDPAMNWRVDNLDGITLISNSDAHSPSKLGREANLFTTQLSYAGIRAAITSGDPDRFAGTFEFFPEEGKYHVDGHRKCGVQFTPAQTRSHSGNCPVCGKPLTLGVLHRVETLATRPQGYRPLQPAPFFRLIPLDDLLSEILSVGAQSKKVQGTVRFLLERLGCEFNILHRLDRETIASAGVPLLDEAICRMRADQVSFSPGYDGHFGTVRIFDDLERARLFGQRSLFSGFNDAARRVGCETSAEACTTTRNRPDRPAGAVISAPDESQPPPIQLNRRQQLAVEHGNGPLMIVAGPGTGKTRTLTFRIARLVEQGTPADRLLAVTFTNKAAAEMRSRLTAILGKTRPLPFVGTFHALGYTILKQAAGQDGLLILDTTSRRALIRDAVAMAGISGPQSAINVERLTEWLVGLKQNAAAVDPDQDDGALPDEPTDFKRCYDVYEQLLRLNRRVDFEDLIVRATGLMTSSPRMRDRYAGRFSHIFIDEYQDINAGQYRLIRLLAGTCRNICVIGDPDQSIYAFRGSHRECFQWFQRDFQDARTIFLKNNYRSTQTILEVSSQVIQRNPELSDTLKRQPVHSGRQGDPQIHVMTMATEKSEAVAIGKTIESMVGGTGFLSLDSGVVDAAETHPWLSFSDFAVLFRTRSQATPILSVLEKAGIPCQLVDRTATLDHAGMQALLAAVKVFYGVGLFSDLEQVTTLLRARVSVKSLELLKKWAYSNHLSMPESLTQARRFPIPDLARSAQQRLVELAGRIAAFRREVDRRSVGDAVDWIATQTGLREKYAGDRLFEQGLRSLRLNDARYQTDPAGFLAVQALSGDTDLYDHRVEKVSLMTMHAAKGLEFPVVFIAGCEKDWIPFRSAGRLPDIEEERRLFYVALTRAKTHLLLTRAAVRYIRGQKRFRRWSPFLADIDSAMKNVSESRLQRSRTPAQEQLALF